MAKPTWEVEPGGLSASHHEKIFELAERGWKPHSIARRIKKHPATVYWFMLTKLLVAPRPNRTLTDYQRGGRTVRHFSVEEDAFLTALRVQNFGTTEIARLTNARFKTERTPHSVTVRLVMLAAREEA